MIAGEQDVYEVATPERRLPPITAIAVLAMALVIVGGIDIAAQIPGQPALAPPAVLTALAAALLVADLVILSRVRPFAWRRFRLVFGCTLAAYVVIAGMIGYVLVDDGTRGGSLALLVIMLLVYAVDIPLLLAFTVARYEQVEGEPGA
ncbi:MAG TPA: hypothetical protein VFA70_01375 [Dehalococcoidia bacterium]|nr:hypothetical protein [Dehalococcoidia bacterium]